jgi:hypothetical protein
MMSANTQAPCHRAFAAGQHARAASPLPSGAYKLREVQRFVEHYKSSMHAIRDYLTHPKKFYPGAPLGYCTTDDKATYLKGIPENIARLFGKDVLPSIKALGADGLGEQEIATELEIATYEAQKLIQECEIQRQRLRGGIKDEYDAIKSDYSELYALLEDAEQIIKSPLQAVERNKATAPQS